MGKYRVFVRNWWKPGKDGKLEPNSGSRGRTIRRNVSLEEARRICAEYNAENDPGKYSKKAEFTAQ